MLINKFNNNLINNKSNNNYLIIKKIILYNQNLNNLSLYKN